MHLRRIKLILAAATSMAVLTGVTASPAMAQTFFVGGGEFEHFDRDHFIGNVGPASQEFSIRRVTSGAASPVTNVSNSGSNANLAPTVQQTANTGNVANEQGVLQFFSEADDIDFTGSSLEISPSLSSDNTQTIEQAAADQ